MKETFIVPQFTTLCSPQSIASNVASVSLTEESRLEPGMLVIERTGSSVRWHQEGTALIFRLDALSTLQVQDLRYGGEHFVALVLTFVSDKEALRYRMITSHASESDWLRKSAERIGNLVSLPVALEGGAS
jgi:hypothetical protein